MALQYGAPTAQVFPFTIPQQQMDQSAIPATAAMQMPTQAMIPSPQGMISMGQMPVMQMMPGMMPNGMPNNKRVRQMQNMMGGAGGSSLNVDRRKLQMQDAVSEFMSF